MMTAKGRPRGAYLVIHEDAFAKMVGRTMQFIEAMGLPERQEEATKKNIKRIIHAEQNEAEYLQEDVFDELREDGLPIMTCMHVDNND